MKLVSHIRALLLTLLRSLLMLPLNPLVLHFAVDVQAATKALFKVDLMVAIVVGMVLVPPIFLMNNLCVRCASSLATLLFSVTIGSTKLFKLLHHLP